MQTWLTRKERHLLVRVEELEGWKRKLVIGLPEAEVKARAEQLLSEVAKDATAPGFRKGKVPKSMVARTHGGTTMAEALRELAGNAYADAVREAGIHPICDPVVELGDEVTDGNYTLTATVEVKPEIELKDYENLEFTERVPVITSEDVDRYIEELREQQAELRPATRPSVAGDVVVIDYEALDDDGKPLENAKTEDHVCELGKAQVPPEIDEALLGVSAGDEKTVAVSYPEDFRVESLAGRTISFAIKVKDVREKLLAPLDDGFAKSVGLETVLDLRVKVRNALEERAKTWARGRLEEQIVREIVERNPFELPECLVEDRLKQAYMRTRQGGDGSDGGVDADGPIEIPEDFSKVYRPVVEQQLKAGLVLGKIAETHGTEVTKEDIEQRVAQIAEAQGQKPEELLENLKGTDALSQLEDEMWLEKVHEYLVSISNVTTEPFEATPESEGVDESAAAGGDAG